MIAAKKKYDQATANLKELLDKRDAIRKEEILSAVVKNEWQSYEEIMNFFGNERYNLMVHAPEYKEKLFGSAGGR